MINTTELLRCQHNYNICRRRLAIHNKIPVANDHQRRASKGVVMATMNRCRAKLHNEIKRISWLVWPKTGRPGG